MPAPTRFYLLYARQLLRSFRVALVVVTLGYVAFGAYQAYTQHNPILVLTGLAYAIVPVLFALVIYTYSRLTYIEFTDGGVRIRQFPRTSLIPYTDIEKGRVDTVQHIFDRPDRKRLQTGPVRGLYKQNALCLRIRSDEGQPDNYRRQLGNRTIIDREAILPVSDVDAAMAALKQRLGARRQVAEPALDGGTRRRRGKRGR